MNFRSSHWASRPSLLLAFGLLALAAIAAPPVELRFKLPPDRRNPFTLELWADVSTPSGKVEHLPAFFLGDGQFAVRARVTERGEYRLRAVTEWDGTRHDNVLAVKVVGSGRQNVTEVESLQPVMRSAAEPTRLVLANGTPFTPIGANLAWPPSGKHPDYYASAFAQFQSEHLNWMRVWMAHWSNLNLDWSSGASGALDLKVAAEWDKIIAGADDHGVYVQLVLQHHGQYSSTVNSNWAANPWNASHPGGFLKSPAEFFTSAKARELTEWKYRYIVARWGYSPAIVAWELFNEVHWTDAFKTNEGDVAAWHAAMAKFIRNIDTYHHLVTTSTENLASPVYAEMDYFQPHLYSADVIAGARAFSPPPGELNRPVFYGEMGDDHLPLTVAQKESGISIAPPVWASLMGQGRLPAQPWLGADLIEQKRLGELGAVARFVEATKLDQRANLTAFSAVVDSATRRPLTIEGVQRWQRRPAVDLDLPLDGRMLVEFANIPQVFAGSAAGRAAGIPGRATFHLDAPRELVVRAMVIGMAPHGASIRISVDGQPVAEKSWAAEAPDAPTATHPVELPFKIPAGKHTLLVENPAGPDWFELAHLVFDLDVSALASIGQRNDNFIALWLWDRANVFSLEQPAAITGKIEVGDVPAGRWQVVWWDTIKGVPSAPVAIEHAGGTLLVPTPPISRQAAVVLTRL